MFLVPCLPHANLQEGSLRDLDFADEHVFLFQGSSTISNDPSLISPLSFLLPNSNPHLLRVYVNGSANDIFPQSAQYRTGRADQLFVVSSHSLPKVDTLQLCFYEHERPPPAIPQPDSPTITIRDTATSFLLTNEPMEAKEMNINLLELIKAQAASYVALSKSVPHTHSLTPISPSIPKRRLILRVYCHTFSSKKPEELSVKCLAQHKSPVVKPRNSCQGQTVFSIDLSAFPEEVLEKGLLLSPSVLPEKTLTWYPSLGDHVIHAESFGYLLTPNQTDVTIMYHRYGDLVPWKDWELHIWTDSVDEYPAQSTMLLPERSDDSGPISFVLTCMIFPANSVIHAQPVRMATFKHEDTVNEHGVTIPGEQYRDACRRDIVRTWKSGQTPSPILHFVQGNATVHPRAPSSSLLESSRRFILRYRRFEPDDYKGWDLWTWDDADPKSHRVAVPPTSKTRAWVDFVIDRANYGAGARISVMPRKGGDEWNERDQPFRVWGCDLLAGASRGMEVALLTCQSSSPIKAEASDELVKFLIIQGSEFVFQRLEEVKAMMRAYVDGEHSVTIKTPVPIGWVSPPRRGCAQAVSNSTLHVCDKKAEALLQDAASSSEFSNRTLRFRKVQEISHTEARLVFEPKEVTFDEDYLVENVIVSVPGFESVPLTWEIHADWDAYLYPGKLGWDYSPSRTLFRCFSPTSDSVSVVMYSSAAGGADRNLLPMRRISHGCWKAIALGDQKGKYYKLLAEGENKRLFPGVEVIDPYSRCNTSHTGRGLIFGNECTNIYPRPNVKPAETIIYELHIRDLTIDEDSGISLRGKYLGLTERGTRIRGAPVPEERKPLTPWEQEKMPGTEEAFQNIDRFSTGLDHIVQMGVNTIQILPIQDFDNDEENDEAYGWGYMPVHFNSPDGWYATSTSSVARVTEFKMLVDAAHKVGLKVIMDVVYNHTAEDSNEYNLDARFSFNGVAPRYYYRTCGNTPVAFNGASTCATRKPEDPRCGSCYSNGSGCGNEFRSEAPMGRKFIIDSLKYWVTEFQVDGFRFDLLGLIDVETLRQASAELKTIDSNIMLYGEPWCGGLTPIKVTDKGSQRSKGFSVFNDTFRDAIRGSSFHVEENFIMDGGRASEIKGGLIGSIDKFCDGPLETINYVECHDNYTLWDQMRHYINSRTDNITFTEQDMRRMSRLSALIIFTSQGVPFIQAGQEMCRTKFDVENSYNSPDEINKIRWTAKQKEWATVQYYRGLILLRRSHPEIFCLDTADEIHKAVIFYEDLGLSVPERSIAYKIKGNPERLQSQLRSQATEETEEDLLEKSLQWTEVIVLLNPTPSEILFQLPGAEHDCIWIQVVDAASAGLRKLRGPAIGTVSVPGRSGAVLRKASENEEAEAQLELRLNSVSASYSCFHGNNPLSRYAVGLSEHPTEEDRIAEENLTTLRKEFEENRLRDQNSYGPPDIASEEAAIAIVNRKHGKPI